MDKVKVITGVAAGVGSVALLPVFGPIGTVSLLGAVLGGTAGGIAGAVLSENDDARCGTDSVDGMGCEREPCIHELDEAEDHFDACKNELHRKSEASKVGIVYGLSTRNDAEKKTEGDAASSK